MGEIRGMDAGGGGGRLGSRRRAASVKVSALFERALCPMRNAAPPTPPPPVRPLAAAAITPRSTPQWTDPPCPCNACSVPRAHLKTQLMPSFSCTMPPSFLSSTASSSPSACFFKNFFRPVSMWAGGGGGVPGVRRWPSHLHIPHRNGHNARAADPQAERSVHTHPCPACCQPGR